MANNQKLQEDFSQDVKDDQQRKAQTNESHRDAMTTG